LKSKYPDSILFFGMGDFYEMVFDDARIVSDFLGMPLTIRETCNGDKMPVCIIPYHTHMPFVHELTEIGWKVVFLEKEGAL